MTYLDVPVTYGEPYKERYERHDEYGHAEDHATLDPVKSQDAGPPVEARLTPSSTRQAKIRAFVVIR